MSETQVDADMMQATANKFEQVNDSLQGMLQKLMGQLEGLESSWRGAGGSAFTDVKARYQQDQQKMSQALAITVEAIRESSGSYSTTDSEAASKMAASNAGLQLPL
jgi:WXG100 family type VII secretion target